jgi:hypothetical protein
MENDFLSHYFGKPGVPNLRAKASSAPTQDELYRTYRMGEIISQ